MTLDADIQTARTTFGVGRTLGRSFGAFFSSFWRLAALIVIPMILASHAMDGIGPVILDTLDSPFWTRPHNLGGSGIYRHMPLALLPVLAIKLAISLLIWSAAILAVSSKINGQKTGLTGYLLIPLRKLPQVLILSVAVCLVIAVSYMIVVIVPFSTGSAVFTSVGYVAWIFVLLHILAAFSPLMPVILVEGTGWRALSRSLDLTRGCRWPIAGLVLFCILLIVLLLFLMGEVIGYVNIWTLANDADFERARIIGDALDIGIGAIITGYSASLAVVIFNRLLAVRDGPMANVETVFD